MGMLAAVDLPKSIHIHIEMIIHHLFNVVTNEPVSERLVVSVIMVCISPRFAV